MLMGKLAQALQTLRQIHHAAKTRHGFLRFWHACLLSLNPAWQHNTKPHHQQGFTMLEMLVVIGLIGIVALGTTTMLIDDGDWKRQLETEARWNNIRKAIVGEPNTYLNGSPYVAGYVADMGRLPVSVFELIAQSDTATTFDHDNNAATAEITIDQPDWTEVDLYTAATGYTAKLGGGWRGPYLYTSGSAVYRDGWNNDDGDVDNDLFNFGWRITLTGTYPDVTDIAVQSLGLDNQTGGVETNADFPADASQIMVSENEWTLSTAPITFNINFNKAVSATTTPPTLPPIGTDSLPQELELRIYRYIDNGDANADFANDIEEESADATFTLTEGDVFAPAQTLTPTTNLPVGRFAAVLWCVNNTPASGSAPAGADAVYDGNCDTTFNHNPVYFTLTHNSPQVTITWNLP